MNDKGELPFVFLISSLLLLIIFILIIVFQSNLFDVLDESAGDTACKTSVYTHATLKLSGKDTIESGKINCPMRIVNIEKEEEIFPKVANELYNCWNNFGEGNLELFEPEDAMYCVICSNIKFDKMQGTKKGFLSYLVKTKIPGKDKTYFDYLNGVKFNDNVMTNLNNEIIKSDSGELNLDKDLSVIFVYGKDSKVSNKETSLYGTIGGSVIATIGAVRLVSSFTPVGGILTLLINPYTLSLTAGTVGGVTGALAGGYTGYFLGSDSSANWDAKVLVLPYDKENIDKLGCTNLPVRGEAIEIN